MIQQPTSFNLNFWRFNVDLFIVITFILYGYGMFLLGKLSFKRQVGTTLMQDALTRAAIPIGILEKIKDKYYLYEKDSTNFLCQAERLEDIPMSLWENKKISIAVIMYPELSGERTFWCVNGKLRVLDES